MHTFILMHFLKDSSIMLELIRQKLDRITIHPVFIEIQLSVNLNFQLRFVNQF